MDCLVKLNPEEVWAVVSVKNMDGVDKYTDQ